MEHVTENSPTAQLVKDIEAGIELKYLGEIQRLTDGLHEVKDALSGKCFSEQAGPELLDAMIKEYALRAVTELLVGKKVESMMGYFANLGFEVVRSEQQTKTTEE